MPFNVCFSKLCSKPKGNKDYEAIPYEQKPKHKQLPSPVRVQVEQNRARLDHLNKLKKCTTKRNLFKEPEFQSTKLEQSKVTSTMIHQEAFAKQQASPSLTFISEESTCSISSDYSEECSSHFELTQYFTNPSCASDAFQDVNPSFFEKSSVQTSDMVYVCVQSYQPQFQGDIGLQYTERVNVLHATEEFSLVKKISSQECGYVPSSCLTTFSSFIKSIC